MKLRLGRAHGATQAAGNFMVFVSFNFVENKNRPITNRQLFHGTSQRKAVDRSRKMSIRLPELSFLRVGELADRLIER